MENKLLPCPFCGDKMKIVKYPNADYGEHTIKNIEDCPIRDIEISDSELWDTRKGDPDGTKLS